MNEQSFLSWKKNAALNSPCIAKTESMFMLVAFARKMVFCPKNGCFCPKNGCFCPNKGCFCPNKGCFRPNNGYFPNRKICKKMVNDQFHWNADSPKTYFPNSFYLLWFPETDSPKAYSSKLSIKPRISLLNLT